MSHIKTVHNRQPAPSMTHAAMKQWHDNQHEWYSSQLNHEHSEQQPLVRSTMMGMTIEQVPALVAPVPPVVLAVDVPTSVPCCCCGAALSPVTGWAVDFRDALCSVDVDSIHRTA